MAKKTEFSTFAHMSILLLTVVSGEILQRPLNAATAVSGETIINCSSTISVAAITWIYSTDCNSFGGTTLTDSNCNITSSQASHYRTEKPDGFVCNLVVFDAVLSLGGCYVCGDGTGPGRQYSAFLIVVDSKANITTNTTDLISGEDVMLWNSVSYGGPSLQPLPLPPSFYWTLQSDPNQNITSYPGSTTTNSASSYIFVKAQKPDVPPFVCNLFFNAPVNVPQGYANNTPTYRTSWNTPIYKVSYPPENMNISEIMISCPYDESVVLTCSASGYPILTYKWFDLTNGGGPYEESTFKIDRGGTYQCDASNIIRGVIYTESMYVNISHCFTYVVDDVPPSTCVNLGISDPVCISLLVIVIFFGLNLLCFTVFIIDYGCSENGRNTLNNRFPWLKKMLPCINGDGCIRFQWIFLFAIISIFASIVFFPTIIIVANCWGKKKKSNEGDINLRQEVYIYENVVKPNTLPEPESYESLQRPAAQATTSDSLYEELTQRH